MTEPAPPTPPDPVSAAWLRDAVRRTFAGAGLSAAAAAAVAEALVDADMRGVPSHGTLLVPMYVERLRAGSVATAERAQVVVDDGAVAVLDAGHALGVLTGDQAMALAVEKATRHGVGVVTVRRAFHFGGAFRYVEAAVAAGCVGIAAANTRPLMPAPGGAAPVVGNNPLAIGIPVAGRDPIVLDMALSEAALGKIRLAAQAGRPIPPTWATDADGTPTTDAQAAIDGMLLPAAGHKGYGLALALDVLTGVLSGGSFGPHVQGLYADTSAPNDCAHLFLALGLEPFGGLETVAARTAELAAHATGGPRAPGVERLLLPGQPEAERHARAREQGVALDAGVLAALRETAASVGVALGAPEAAGA